MNTIGTGPLHSDSMRENLTLFFTADNIRKVMQSIDDNKPPGLDGYNSRFYKAAWSVVGPNVVTAIQSFFQARKLSKAWSLTTITLKFPVPMPQVTLGLSRVAMSFINVFPNLFAL